VLLIITGKGDGTVDVLAQYMSAPFFRLNLDDFRSYEFSFENSNWQITNSAGLKIDSTTASRCFWWKAFMYQVDSDKFVREEIKLIGESLYSWFLNQGKAIGNPPSLESTWGKFRQASIASRYMEVPQQKIGWGSEFLSQFDLSTEWVAKSLSANLTESGKALFTTAVNPSQLDPNYPWYIQNKVTSDVDVTVLVAGKKLFAFERSRAALEGLDWRKEQFSSDESWHPLELEQSERAAILSMLNDMDIAWGRIDFLRKGTVLQFLELNPNGQWVFLDPLNKSGLITEVIEYLQTGETHS
jgi:hypothetical protein